MAVVRMAILTNMMLLVGKGIAEDYSLQTGPWEPPLPSLPPAAPMDYM